MTARDHLWPIRPGPLPDELLSSWIVRMASSNGLKVQHFSDLVFGQQRQIWNRDIDRLAPRWLLGILSRHTGISFQEVKATTLLAYQGRLIRKLTHGYYLRWMLPLKIYHRKRLARGIQFCPLCLSEDSIPYFRRSWRVAFCTFCPEHDMMLADSCPSCSSPVVFHRGELGKPEEIDSGGITLCHACRFDLRKTMSSPPPQIDSETDAFVREMICSLNQSRTPFTVAQFDMLHQFSKLLLSREHSLHLNAFVRERLCLPECSLPGKATSYEALPLLLRHRIIAMAAWIFLDFENRLEEAWKQGSVRYNLLLKDFEEAPAFYVKIVEKFNRRQYATPNYTHED